MNDDEIRSLLRDARVTEPMPASVADRLDDVLAGLRDSSPEPELAPVVPLRRRVAPRLLAAAAAVVLVAGVGVGLQQVLQDGQVDSAQSDGASTADRAMPEEEAPVPAPAEASKSLNGTSSLDSSARSLDDADLRVDLHRLASRQVDRLSDFVDARMPAAQLVPLSGTLTSGYSSTAGRIACFTPVLATLPGTRSSLVPRTPGAALLVVGPDQGAGVHLVELWGCASHDLIARETLDLG